MLLFFIYGLAFFSMGIALLLESSRSPLLSDRRVYQVLALFGLLHGMHEWMEIILVQSGWLGLPFPPELAGWRLALLAVSFLPLIVFGPLSLMENRREWVVQFFLPTLLGGYAVSLAINYSLYPEAFLGRAEALTRYWLAVPGGLLAGWALIDRAAQAPRVRAGNLVMPLRLAAAGFFAYGLSQAFPAGIEMFPATLVNAEAFRDLFGFPIQAARAGFAVLITFGIIRAIQTLEQERREQLFTAQQARLEALENVQQEMIKREGMHREYLRKIVMTQEEERSRIARELHDESAQLLTAMSLNLATFRTELADNKYVSLLVDRLLDLNRQMSQGIYRMVHDLRPAQLDDLGLVPALEYLVEDGTNCMGLKVAIEIEGERRRLEPLIETVIFRIAQEGLTNVCRHAETDRALVKVAFGPEQVSLKVIDEGKGFVPGAVESPQAGMGLVGMRERAESVGGEFSVRSSPGEGTEVAVVIPLTQDEPAGVKEEMGDGERNPDHAG